MIIFHGYPWNELINVSSSARERWTDPTKAVVELWHAWTKQGRPDFSDDRNAQVIGGREMTEIPVQAAPSADWRQNVPRLHRAQETERCALHPDHPSGASCGLCYPSGSVPLGADEGEQPTSASAKEAALDTLLGTVAIKPQDFCQRHHGWNAANCGGCKADALAGNASPEPVPVRQLDGYREAGIVHHAGEHANPCPYPDCDCSRDSKNDLPECQRCKRAVPRLAFRANGGYCLECLEERKFPRRVKPPVRSDRPIPGAVKARQALYEARQQRDRRAAERALLDETDV